VRALTPLQGLPTASTVGCHVHCLGDLPDLARALKLQRHKEQTAHLQPALLHSGRPVRLAQPGSRARPHCSALMESGSIRSKSSRPRGVRK
jgi:hypothetical protein